MSEHHPDPSRRDFVKDTGVLLTGATASAVLGLGAAPAAEKTEKVPTATLGRTRAEVSRLAIGCAWFQRKHVGSDDVRKVLHRALDLGVTYLDVAPNYGNAEIGFSEEKMGPTIKDIRDKVFLVTKTEEPTYEGTWKLLRQSMKRLQTDHFDLVHIHNFGHEPRFPDLKLALGDKGVLGALREAKKKGVVRFIGASGHLHPSRFHAVLDTGEVDVLMNAVNFVARHTYDFEHKVWARARRDNLGLVAMKVLGGAGTGEGRTGFRLPKEQYHNAIRYALSVPGVTCTVIGIETISELEQAAEAVRNFKPLSEKESHQLAKLGLELAASSEWKSAYGTPVT
jgi:aryl-alcohol dehydrogenase-like predicted oxidoreductase